MSVAPKNIQGFKVYKTISEVIKSPKDVKISGNNIASSAQSAYKVDAMSINQSASQGINLKAGTELKAEGGVGAILKGGGTVKVEAGAMATVKGAMNQIG